MITQVIIVPLINDQIKFKSNFSDKFNKEKRKRKENIVLMKKLLAGILLAVFVSKDSTTVDAVKTEYYQYPSSYYSPYGGSSHSSHYHSSSYPYSRPYYYQTNPVLLSQQNRYRIRGHDSQLKYQQD